MSAINNAIAISMKICDYEKNVDKCSSCGKTTFNIHSSMCMKQQVNKYILLFVYILSTYQQKAKLIVGCKMC